ncbi:MAG: hypothetical protein KC503_09430 [Myxococcales bacterium]|nr:hypothetical protein [Myxococcales bacterium]
MRVSPLCLTVCLASLSGVASAAPPSAAEAAKLYRWKRTRAQYEPLSARFAAPGGFERVETKRGSYGWWLRHLPLRAKGTPVRSYRGREILPGDHKALAAVVDMDVGRRDLQQCADTLMRVRGEYHFASGKPRRTRFLWAGGRRFGYAHWIEGKRPVKQGRRWVFAKKARACRGYRCFRRYLTYMFAWTGTIHQMGEQRVRGALRIGDFFIQGGSPGHVVVIVDLARDKHGKLKAMIAQGYMPAQDMHVMRAPDGSPWFDLVPGSPVRTPIWSNRFEWKQLRRFKY